MKQAFFWKRLPDGHRWLFSRDVGTGKTALAESVGDVVACLHKIDMTLFPISLSARGIGRVGEMTKLISSAFDFALNEAERRVNSKGKSVAGVLLLVDEADALAQSRESEQMHHEDKAGVNAFIRGVDRVGQSRAPMGIIMCTNRLSAIDPAVRRRAAEIIEFSRPNEAQCKAALHPLMEVGFTEEQISRIAEVTGKQENGYGFTYSDIVQRLLPTSSWMPTQVPPFSSNVLSTLLLDETDSSFSGNLRRVKKPTVFNAFKVTEDVWKKRIETADISDHPGAKGDVAENAWRELLKAYLPARYRLSPGFVINCEGQRSHQIDCIIYDNIYTPNFFGEHGVWYIPAEAVYAVFEIKQEVNRGNILYASNKVESVRSLYRTSAPYTGDGQEKPPKPTIEIIGGLLARKIGNWSTPNTDAE